MILNTKKIVFKMGLVFLGGFSAAGPTWAAKEVAKKAELEKKPVNQKKVPEWRSFNFEKQMIVWTTAQVFIHTDWYVAQVMRTLRKEFDPYSLGEWNHRTSAFDAARLATGAEFSNARTSSPSFLQYLSEKENELLLAAKSVFDPKEPDEAKQLLAVRSMVLEKITAYYLTPDSHLLNYPNDFKSKMMNYFANPSVANEKIKEANGLLITVKKPIYMNERVFPDLRDVESFRLSVESLLSLPLNTAKNTKTQELQATKPAATISEQQKKAYEKWPLLARYHSLLVLLSQQLTKTNASLKVYPVP